MEKAYRVYLMIEKILSECVSGKTFADIGPLWETVNEKVSIAHKYGATSLTAIDKFHKTDPLWQKFIDRMKSQNINCEYLSGNVLDYKGTFDVVTCGGVIYHAPDPIHLLKKLRQITKEKLILTSTITPAKISNEEGEFNLPEGSLVFIPALSQQNKRIISKHWDTFMMGRPDGGLMSSVVWEADNYSHWWWLFTPETLNAMCSSCGFKINATYCEEYLYTMDLC
jgi:SAM-dependent methyltransferase